MAGKYENLVPLIGASFDVDTAADKVTLTIPFKCRVYRAQVTITSTDAGGGTVKFDWRPTAGSDTGRGDGDIASIVLAASDKQGYCYYDIAGRGTILNEGDQVVVEVTSDPGAGATMVPCLIVDYIPEVEGNNAAMVETA